MTLEELLNIDLTGKDTVVLGKAASGKTTIARLLSKKWGMPLLSTDDYMGLGWEEALYAIMDDLQARSAPVLAEGVQMYRAVRKGLELNTYKPDVIIMLEISTKKQTEIYAKERGAKKIKYMRSFNAGLMSVFNDYMKLLQNEEKKPQLITLNNEWV